MTTVIAQCNDEKTTLLLQLLANNKQPWAGHLNPRLLQNAMGT
jgi:hypothetical protein